MSLVELVELNLTYHLLWSEIDTVSIEFKTNDDKLHKIGLIYGKPPKQLNPTIPYKKENAETETGTGEDKNQDKNHDLKEWVLPILKSTQLTIEKIDLIFDNIKSKSDLNQRPKRILLGIIDEDSSIVYYTIHDGVTKPRQS
ncbi:hypothetical protein BVG19_g366 [[Candida] boidinii]|nr:hypothetical protein BVG19_g366 [[Candida] boidinii]OWB49555.1 hypothetical protein B5S27_g1096 [[Candida] boidinii]OWB81902.1 hypothetical protein B5S33_g522 [[Candida] boidinii]